MNKRIIKDYIQLSTVNRLFDYRFIFLARIKNETPIQFAGREQDAESLLQSKQKNVINKYERTIESKQSDKFALKTCITKLS